MLEVHVYTERVGQVEKQDMSGNEREREHECESEMVDHVMVVSTCLLLGVTLKAGLILEQVSNSSSSYRHAATRLPNHKRQC